MPRSREGEGHRGLLRGLPSWESAAQEGAPRKRGWGKSRTKLGLCARMAQAPAFSPDKMEKGWGRERTPERSCRSSPYVFLILM